VRDVGRLIPDHCAGGQFSNKLPPVLTALPLSRFRNCENAKHHFVDDQFDNAVRVRRLGAGLKMSHLAYRPRTVARNLERLLSSKEIAQSCRSLAARLKQQGPLAEACRLIEELALRRPEN
jgi:hypothetical protein